LPGSDGVLCGSLVTLDLSGVRLKLSRAAYHLNNLYDEAAFGTERDIELRSEYDEGQQGHVIFYEGPPIPPEWGVIAGDCVHNTRSSLDHLIAALVRANGGKLMRADSFPVCVTEADYKRIVTDRDPDRGRGPLDGLTEGQREVVKDCQPMKGRTPEDARKTLLYRLHSFWNADKHRIIHAGTGYIAEGDLKIELSPPGMFVIQRVVLHALPGTLLVPGAKLAVVQIGQHIDAPMDTEMHMQLGLPSSVLFSAGSATPIANFGTFGEMIVEVVEIVRRFDPTFGVEKWRSQAPPADRRRPPTLV